MNTAIIARMITARYSSPIAVPFAMVRIHDSPENRRSDR